MIATVLIIETKSLLIGEGVGADCSARSCGELAHGKVERVIHIRTQYLSPDELLVAAKIAFVPELPLAEVAQGHRRRRRLGCGPRCRWPR